LSCLKDASSDAEVIDDRAADVAWEVFFPCTFFAVAIFLCLLL